MKHWASVSPAPDCAAKRCSSSLRWASVANAEPSSDSSRALRKQQLPECTSAVIISQITASSAGTLPAIMASHTLRLKSCGPGPMIYPAENKHSQSQPRELISRVPEQLYSDLAPADMGEAVVPTTLRRACCNSQESSNQFYYACLASLQDRAETANKVEVRIPPTNILPVVVPTIYNRTRPGKLS